MKKILFNFSRLLLLSLIANLATPAIGQEAKDIAALPPERGIAVITGQGGREMARYVLEMAHRSEYTIFFQSPDGATVLAVRKAADGAGLLGQRVFVEQSGLDRICLGDNMADIAIVRGTAVKETELLRVLRPGAAAQGSPAADAADGGADRSSRPMRVRLGAPMIELDDSHAITIGSGGAAPQVDPEGSDPILAAFGENLRALGVSQGEVGVTYDSSSHTGGTVKAAVALSTDAPHVLGLTHRAHLL